MTHPEDPYRSGPPEQPPVWQPSAQDAPTWSTPPPQGYGPPPQAYGQVPAYGGYAGPQQTSTRAIVALVCAIGSWVVFPLIPAVVALALVPGAREEIDLSGGRVSGDGLLTATKVVAWLNIGLCIGGVLLAIAAFTMFASVGFS